MNRSAVALLLLVGSIAVAPSGASCVIDNEPLCDLATTAMFDEIFGDAADIGFIAIGLLVVAGVLQALVWLILRFRIRRLMRLTVAEAVREVEPGKAAKFKLEVENLQSGSQLEVLLEPSNSLPAGWTSESSVSLVTSGGFRIPQTPAAGHGVVLLPAPRGANRAMVELRITAPADLAGEETMETEFHAVPVVAGTPKKGKGKKARLTVLVTPHLPKVQITKVIHQPERISAGTPVTTRATLVNKGDRDAREIAVAFTLNGLEVDKKIVPALAVEGAADVEFNWTPTHGENKIRVSIAS